MSHKEPDRPPAGVQAGPARPTWLSVAAWLIVLGAVAARLSGPSDLHDQTQEKTIAYTMDLVLHPDDWKHWVLPVQQQNLPATKPPLYNWVDMPFVWLTDGRSEMAYQIPTILAFFGICAVLWLAGSRLDAPERSLPSKNHSRDGRSGKHQWSGLTAPLTIMIFSTNFAWYKLTTLVRPDTLLSLWVLIGFYAANRLFLLSEGQQSAPAADAGISSSAVHRETRLKILLWSATALGFLTKGPAALLVPIYILVYGGLVQHRGEKHRLKRIHHETALLPGLVAAMGVGAIWFGLVYAINPSHAVNVLVGDEVVDRVLGSGNVGSVHGLWDIFFTAWEMPFYFVSRFIPWIIFFLALLVDYFGRPADGSDGPIRWRAQNRTINQRVWINGSLTFIAMDLIIFSLSAGKRSDYIAAAYGPAALVTAWWMAYLGRRLAVRAPWLTPGLAIVTVAGLMINDRTLSFAHEYPLSDALWEAAPAMRSAIESRTIQDGGSEARVCPTIFYLTGTNPLQTILHCSQPVITDQSELRRELEGYCRTTVATSSPRPFPHVWLIAPVRFIEQLRSEPGWGRDEWTYRLRTATRKVNGPTILEPYQVGLYAVSPRTSQ